MKKITIGRNNACDIIIPDTSDLVSRKQAILSVSFFGKMILYDTSNNGTYVNGQPVETGKGVRVTRKDKVNFARIVDLDWNEVKDPYKKEKSFVLLGTVVLLLTIVLIVVSPPIIFEKEGTIPAVESNSTPMKGEVKTTVQPIAVQSQPEVQPSRSKMHNKTMKRKKIIKQKKKEYQPERKAEENDESPLLY